MKKKSFNTLELRLIEQSLWKELYRIEKAIKITSSKRHLEYAQRRHKRCQLLLDKIANLDYVQQKNMAE